MGRSRGTLTRKGRNGRASHALNATAPASYSTGDSRERSVARGLAAEGGGPAAAGGARETRSALERGEEPSRGPDAGGGVRIFGLHLLGLCGVAGVAVVDEQRIYDPHDQDDTLRLELKGAMSEAEIHWLR
jgi:hypothetical protein